MWLCYVSSLSAWVLQTAENRGRPVGRARSTWRKGVRATMPQDAEGWSERDPACAKGTPWSARPAMTVRPSDAVCTVEISGAVAQGNRVNGLYSPTDRMIAGRRVYLAVNMPSRSGRM